MKKLIGVLLLLVLIVGLIRVPANAADAGITYTINLSSTSLAENWNPHSWRTAQDQEILKLVSAPFVDRSIYDSSDLVYQWTYKAATVVTDVTASHRDDLTGYSVDLGGRDPSEVSEGYVFQITLREGMKWENGEEITADDYIESFRRLLDHDMQNYRAKAYFSGETAVAGANGYYHSGSVGYEEDTGVLFADLTKGADGVYETADGNKVYIAVNYPLDNYLGGATLADYAEYLDPDAIALLQTYADEEGRAPLTEESYAALIDAISADTWGENEDMSNNYFLIEVKFPAVTWDTVGLYKLDEYDLIYVSEAYCDFYSFMESLTDNWLVYTSVYDDNLDPETADTSYGTSAENTVSFGPYRLLTANDTQMVFEKNASYYAYTLDTGTGRYVGTSDWKVDGKTTEVFQADRVVVSRLSEAEAKTAYQNRELDIYEPPYSELIELGQSENLYKEDESFVMRLFFNTDVTALQNMDDNLGNENSVVLSNDSFRKAFSLAINRPEWVSATYGYKPAYTLLNNVYYYDFYADPASNLRRSEQAMEAMCEMYEVGYGEGQTYATLKEAYDSITGYDLSRARSLMAQACQELTAAEYYEQGQPIKIRVAWEKGDPDETDTAQVTLLEDYLNAAAEGSGFGAITLEVCSTSDRYVAVPNGEFAIGYGAWGGAAFYPFAFFRVYCDPDYVSIHESGCWNPSEETLTISINGEDRTETYQWWSNCTSGGNEYGDADNAVKLQIVTQLEKAVLEKYYCIPLAASAICKLTSDKVDYYTHDYSVAYDFGGLELIRFNCTDAEWNNTQHEHVWGEYISNNDATCLKDGTATRTCSVCGETETIDDVGSALGHDYVAAVTAPTCTEGGYTTHTCSRCGDQYTDTETEALGHQWGEWETVIPATETEEGEESRTCGRCGEIETRSVPQMDHVHQLTHVAAVPATCTTAGSTEYWSCSSGEHPCGKNFSDAEGTIEIDAEDIEIPALGHDLVHHDGRSATCTEIGWEEYYTCTRCEYTTYTEVPALGHDYVAAVTAPTCTEDGYTTHTCTRCSDSYVDTPTAALGHDYVAAVTAPTCTEDGYTTHTCTRCSDCYMDTPTAALGHDYVATVTAPTCTEGGYTTHTCSRCSDSYTDTATEALGHNWDDGRITKEATYTKPGVKTYTCDRCGEEREEDIPMLRPEAPVLKSAVNTVNGVTVNWIKSEGATNYRVFRKEGTGSWKRLADVGDVATYTDTTAVGGTKYTYTVRCISADGSYTSTYDTTGVSVTYIAAPVLDSAASKSTGVTVTWTKSKGATNYRVFRKEGTGSWKKLADVGNVATYTDTTAVGGTKYVYTVRCIGTDGSYVSAYDTTGLTVTYIKAPVLKSVTNTATGVTVTWTKSKGATNYRVFRKEGTGSWKKLADVGNVATYTDTTAVAGTKYAYTVRCIGSDGSYVSAYDTTGITVTYIKAPVLDSVTSTATGVTVTWIKSKGATKYRVFRKEGSGSWKKIADVGNVATYTDTTAVGGTKYTYTVRCIGSDGSYVSAYDTTGLTVTYITAPVLKSVTSTSAGVTVTWTKSKGATNYRVFRKEGTGSWKKLADVGNVATYTDKTAVSGKTYSYTVRCISSDGKTYTSAYDTTGKSTANSVSGSSGSSGSGESGSSSRSLGSGSTVYITPTGKRYHRLASCAGSNAIPVDLDEAIARGYTPCKTCVQ